MDSTAVFMYQSHLFDIKTSEEGLHSEGFSKKLLVEESSSLKVRKVKYFLFRKYFFPLPINHD